MNKQKLLKDALELLNMGFGVIPLKEPYGNIEEMTDEEIKQSGKAPLHSFESYSKDILPSFESVSRWWTQNPHANIGILTNGLIMIDADKPEAVEFCDELLKNCHAVVSTGKGKHYYYKRPSYVKTGNKVNRQHGIDFRADNGYGVAPPSLHFKTGNVYQWIKRPKTSAMLNNISREQWKTLQEYIGIGTEENAVEAVSVDYSAILRFYDLQYETSRKPKYSCPFPDHDDSSPSFRISQSDPNIWHCSCQATGNWINFVARMQEYTKANEKLTEDIRQKTIQFIHDKIDPDFEADNIGWLEELNQRYFFLEGSGNPIARIDSDGLTFMPATNFKLKMGNRRIGQTDIASLWLRHPDRRTFEKLVFKPQSIPFEHEYNLFSGWAVERKSGLTEDGAGKILVHIFDTLCDGNQEVYDYVIDWMAQIIQQPEARIKTAIGIQGGQGTGKTTFYNILQQIIGKYALLTSSVDQITARFNANLQNKLLCCLDEALWSGHVISNRMKHVITGDTIQIEHKGGASYSAPNFMRIIAISNNDVFLHLDKDDRRWLVLKVNESRKGDHKYFRELFTSIYSEQGSGELLNFLLERNISQRDFNIVPETKAKQSIQFQTMEAIELWWLEILEAGCIHLKSPVPHLALNPKVWAKNEIVLPVSDFWSSAEEFNKSQLPNNKVSKRKLKAFFEAIYGDRFVAKLVRYEDSPQKSYAIPKLSEARELFALNKFGLSFDELCQKNLISYLSEHEINEMDDFGVDPNFC